jgi:hypothetical protein
MPLDHQAIFAAPVRDGLTAQSPIMTIGSSHAGPGLEV